MRLAPPSILLSLTCHYKISSIKHLRQRLHYSHSNYHYRQIIEHYRPEMCTDPKNQRADGDLEGKKKLTTAAVHPASCKSLGYGASVRPSLRHWCGPSVPWCGRTATARNSLIERFFCCLKMIKYLSSDYLSVLMQ